MIRSGHDGTPAQGQDFGDFLRRELHAAADQIEPHADGLERIRARVRAGLRQRHPAEFGCGAAALAQNMQALECQAQQRRQRASAERSPAMASGSQDRRVAPVGLAIACAVFAVGVALAVPPAA